MNDQLRMTDLETKCALCGCTEESPCPGGCWWVEDPEGLHRDVCSACELLLEQPSESEVPW